MSLLDVKAWVADLVDAGTGVPTIENALGVLRMVLRHAVDHGRPNRNPCEGINAPKRQHKSRAYLTHQQVEQRAMAAREVDGLVVRLLAYMGPAVWGKWPRSPLGRWTCFVVGCRSPKL